MSNDDVKMKRRQLEKLEAEWGDLLAGLKDWTDELRRHRGFCPECGEPMVPVVGKARWRCEACTTWWYRVSDKSLDKYAELSEKMWEEFEEHKGIDNWSEEEWRAWTKIWENTSLPKLIKMVRMIVKEMAERSGV